jgi:outer membrane protein OmpA-like peptidoglycan-associated protein
MRVVAKTGGAHEARLKFDAIVATPVTVTLDPDLSSLDKKQVVFRSNAVVAYAEMTLYGDGGTLSDRKFDLSSFNKGDALVLGWDTTKPITKIDVRIYDPATYWTSYELTPFMVDIPHEEVTFDTGKATFNPSESAKLDRTYELLRREIDAHKDDLLIQLYIAGYTDTVGTSPSNITLSNRRANAIASYFRKKGIKIPIFFQGFGEDVLWVKTEDNVDQAGNRRAVYLLGNQRPPLSDMIPRSDWKRLQ